MKLSMVLHVRRDAAGRGRRSRGRHGQQQASAINTLILVEQGCNSRDILRTALTNALLLPYREPLKGSSQVVRMWGEKIAFSCLQKVNKTRLFHPHPISQNLGRAF